MRVIASLRQSGDGRHVIGEQTVTFNLDVIYVLDRGDPLTLVWHYTEQVEVHRYLPCLIIQSRCATSCILFMNSAGNSSNMVSRATHVCGLEYSIYHDRDVLFFKVPQSVYSTLLRNWPHLWFLPSSWGHEPSEATIGRSYSVT